jgi:hypothetical protein
MNNVKKLSADEVASIENNPPMVIFYGWDDDHWLLPVTAVYDYPRGLDGSCAFCHGDPCAEDADPESPIYKYMNHPDYSPPTCSVCRGAAT